MKAAQCPPQRRTCAALVALVLLAGSAGCASPYRFSPRLDTRLPAADGTTPKTAGDALAGGLDLSLAALMDQRREFWQAAGEVEVMKNVTAFGLIGLGAVGMYRGLQGEASRHWLERAGLIAAATYAGASWLEPSARQSIYLAGAMSLSCLALVTAPYEMPLTDYKALRRQVADSRAAAESLASALRLVGRYESRGDMWWLARGGWNKLRWANRVLDSADTAMGNIEQAGPRLRDMTAMLASEVAIQIKHTSKDLSELPAALAKLKPDANALLGSEVFPPPKKDDVDGDPPKNATDNASRSEADAKEARKDTDPQCSAVTAPEAVKPPAAAPSAPRADPKTPNKEAARKARARASPPATRDTDAYRDFEAHLREAMTELDKHLGPVTSFVQRVSAARQGLTLPVACGAATVKLVPAKSELVLQPGESFQFVLQGDSGKAGAELLGDPLPREVLDVSMPLMRASTVVRLTAGARVPRLANTVLRISDSKGQQHFDIGVKVCPGGS